MILPAVRPFTALQAEDVAEAVVGDVPALGEAGHDLARGVEPDQALGDAGKQDRLGSVSAPAAGSTIFGGSPMTVTSVVPSVERWQPDGASATKSTMPQTRRGGEPATAWPVV